MKLIYFSIDHISGYESTYTYNYVEPSCKKQPDKKHDNINYRI